MFKFKVWKIIVLVLAALLAIAKLILTIVGFTDKPGKKAWREGEKGIVDFFFDRCKELLKA